MWSRFNSVCTNAQSKPARTSFGSYLRAWTNWRKETEQRLAKGHVKNHKLHKSTKEERSRSQKHYEMQHWDISPIVPNQSFGEPRRLLSGNLTATTWASPLVRVFILSCHDIRRRQRPAFHTSTTSKNNVRGDRSTDTHKICPSHINLPTFSISQKLNPITQYLISNLSY